LAMGQQAKVSVENLKNGEVTMNDTKGLQDSIQGMNQQMREGILVDLQLEGKRIEKSIISKVNETPSPPGKRPRKTSVGRQQDASNGIQIIVTDMEVDDVASGSPSGPGYTGYVPNVPNPAHASKATQKLISPAMRRASNYNQNSQDGQTYADKAASKPSGGQPAGQQRKQPPRDQGRRGESNDNNSGNNNNNNGRNRDRSQSGYMKSYGVINDNIAYNHIETREEWVKVEHKSDGQRRRQNKRHKEDEEVTDREVILHGIPTLVDGAPAGKKSDETRVIKILKELRKGGYIVKNGDVMSSGRQVRNNRKPGFQPITITFKEANIADEVKEAAERVGILNERKAKRDDKAKDNIGHLRRSLSEKERKKIGKRAKFYDSAEGKALKEIRKREYESTTNESEWSKVDLEDNEIVDPVDPVDPMGEKETTETDKVKAAQAAQENRQREAIRKVAEAAKNMKLQLKELQQYEANPANLSDDLNFQMDSLLEGLAKTDAENRKMADELASKETFTPNP
jgi:hypothetical protein